jgi:alpha-beta hydrolase superfamily lysophospholipase
MKLWHKKILTWGVFLAVTSWLVATILADFAATVPPVSHPSISPATLGLSSETVSLAAGTEGPALAAWWIPRPESQRPAVIIIHGLGASKEHMIDYILLAHQNGHPVLAIDLRGHGDSAPSRTSLGWYESRDLLRWIRHLESRGHSRPVLWGTSLGAVTALLAAADDPHVGGVIADAPFDNLRHTLAIHGKLMFHLPEFPFTPLTVWRLQQMLDFRADDVDAVRAAARLKAPLLVLAAEHDVRMPLSIVRTVFDAAPEPKTWWMIPGADHETRKFTPDFREAVGRFLNGLPDDAVSAAAAGSRSEMSPSPR